MSIAIGRTPQDLLEEGTQTRPNPLVGPIPIQNTPRVFGLPTLRILDTSNTQHHTLQATGPVVIVQALSGLAHSAGMQNPVSSFFYVNTVYLLGAKKPQVRQTFIALYCIHQSPPLWQVELCY